MDLLLPKPLRRAVEAFRKLPGVGPRSAERFAYYLLQSDPSSTLELANSLSSLHAGIKYCPKTFALIEKGQKLSPLYDDPKRDKKIVAVVADHFDLVAIERTRSFKGTYHVLGGLLSPLEGVGPEQLHLKELITRIDEDNVKEIILATSASVEGESTALLITQRLGKRPVKISRLARGLPVGIDLEYADQITLTRALEGRQPL